MLRVKGWESFQSYKDRKPPWIRMHKTLLDNYKFQVMSDNARALLPMFWLLASEDEDPVSGLIRIGYEEIAFRLRTDISKIQSAVDECVKQDFLENMEPCNDIVTDPLRNCHATVTPETETETETERKKKIQKEKKSFSKSDHEEFAEKIWKEYRPVETNKGVKKQFKEEVFNRIKQEGPEVKPKIEKGLHAYIAHCHRTNTKTKEATRWVKKEGWLAFEEELLSPAERRRLEWKHHPDNQENPNSPLFNLHRK